MLRTLVEGARARRRVAFALIGLFAAELKATLLRVFLYGAVLATMALGIIEIVSRAMPVPQPDRVGDWIEAARDPKLRGTAAGF